MSRAFLLIFGFFILTQLSGCGVKGDPTPYISQPRPPASPPPADPKIEKEKK